MDRQLGRDLAKLASRMQGSILTADCFDIALDRVETNCVQFY